jgi:ankyrin repeat protein
VKFLVIEHGADATAKDGNGWASLHSVSFSDHVEVARVLLEQGAARMAKFIRPHIVGK